MATERFADGRAAIRMLEGLSPDEVGRLKFSLEYALVMGVEDALIAACYDLNITVLQRDTTGLVNKTLYLRLEGRAGDLLRLLRWLDREMEG